ncbi:hypothetical protein B296_00049770 [Ensete ventricosum]|uniref:Uncharacterized protein n=1 Tax=Ensete ventricosum TaxID=4639 RepID=A0A426X3U9_ENSVE|nr:hypothetical protein B296_00049770 [Ensete ventricosum]
MYQSVRLPIRVASPRGIDEAVPRLPTRRMRSRRRLVFPREDEGEAPPRLPAWGLGHCLVFPHGDMATPRSPTGRRGVASSSGSRTRHRLVFQLGDEAAPCLPTGMRCHLVSPARRGYASFFYYICYL